jgi:peroxiredoxin
MPVRRPLPGWPKRACSTASAAPALLRRRLSVPSVSLLAAGIAILCLAAAGDDDPPAPPQPAGKLSLDFTTANIALGEPLAGPELTAESLQHRVVLLAYWGLDCPVCAATLSQLEGVHRTLGPAGLLVIGPNARGGDEAALKNTIESLGVTFPMVSSAVVQGGMDFEAIPHLMLFDHTGRCIARGSPGEVADKVARAVKAAPPLVLAGRTLEKLAGLEKMLRDEAKFGVVLRKAGELVSSAEEATAEEAKYVAEKLSAHADKLLADAEAAKATDAYAAAGLLQRAATAYRGLDAGKRAADLQREWKRDQQFTNGLRAADLSVQLEAFRGQALADASGNRTQPGRNQRGRNQPGQPGREPARMEVVNRIPPAVKGQLAQLAAAVRQLGPGSKYAQRAEEIALELGLELPAGP